MTTEELQETGIWLFTAALTVLSGGVLLLSMLCIVGLVVWAAICFYDLWDD